MSVEVLNIGPSLRGSFARFLTLFPGRMVDFKQRHFPYAKDHWQIDAAVDQFARELWRVNGAEVPDTATAGRRNLRLARWILWLAALLTVVWLPAAALATIWVPMALSPDNQGKEFTIGLVRYVFPVGILLVGLGGFLLLRRGERQLSPYDVSKTLSSGRNPVSGYLHRGIARLIRGKGKLRGLILFFAMFFALGLPALAALDFLKKVGGQQAVQAADLPVLAAMLVFFAWFFLFGGRHWLARRLDLTGRRILQPTADELRRADKREPVVFLRSFYDDTLELQGQDGNLRMEDVITLELPRIGPLIAIGKPTEHLPEIGAARNYYTDDEWQDAVKTWLNEAKVIVLFAGFSKGLSWEINSIASAGHTRKLMVLMPPTEMDKRWSNLREALAQVPAFNGLPGKMPSGLLCVHGTPDGGLALLTSSRRGFYDYERAIDYAMYGMFCTRGGADGTAESEYLPEAALHNLQQTALDALARK